MPANYDKLYCYWSRKLQLAETGTRWTSEVRRFVKKLCFEDNDRIPTHPPTVDKQSKKVIDIKAEFQQDYSQLFKSTWQSREKGNVASPASAIIGELKLLQNA